MTAVTDEMITAWLDGEVSPRQRADVEAAIAASPELGMRVARLSRADRLLAPAYAETLSAPIPARFEALLQRRRAGLDFSGVRSAFAGFLAPRNLGMAAAALIVGVAVGATFLSSQPGIPGIETTADGRMVANNEMAVSLASLQSGDVVSAKGMQVRLSLVDEDGRYCRQFETSGSTGLACLEGGKWMIDTLAPAGHTAGQGATYVMADGTPDPAIASALQRRGVRELLDRDHEAAAIKSGWK